MQSAVTRKGMYGPAALLPQLFRRAAPILALFLVLAAPAMAATPPQVYLSCTAGPAFPPTPICTSVSTPRGGILLTNLGGSPLIISSLTFTGPNAGDFSVTQGCVTTLQPHEICN